MQTFGLASQRVIRKNPFPDRPPLDEVLPHELRDAVGGHAAGLPAIGGTVLAIPSLQGGYLPLAAGAAIGGVLLMLEMAPYGWANRV